MKRLFLILILFTASLSFAAPKLEKQSSSLDVVEKNYNLFAYASGVLLLTSAALNHNKIMVHLNSYYVRFRPYLNQQNLSRSSLAVGSLLAVPLLYLKFKEKDKDKKG